MGRASRRRTDGTRIDTRREKISTRARIAHATPRTQGPIDRWLYAEIAKTVGGHPGNLVAKHSLENAGLESSEMLSLSRQREQWLGRKLDQNVIIDDEHHPRDRQGAGGLTNPIVEADRLPRAGRGGLAGGQACLVLIVVGSAEGTVLAEQEQVWMSADEAAVSRLAPTREGPGRIPGSVELSVPPALAGWTQQHACGPRRLCYPRAPMPTSTSLRLAQTLALAAITSAAGSAHAEGAGDRLHDDFYLRLALGGGFAVGSLDTYTTLRGTSNSAPIRDGSRAKASFAGGVVAFDFAAGVTVARGIAVAGTFGFRPIYGAKTSFSKGAVDDGPYDDFGFAHLGLLVDWYVDPRKGLHFQAGPHMAAISYGVARTAGRHEEDELSASYGGAGLQLGAGYDVFVSKEWSLGGLFRVDGARFAKGKPSFETHTRSDTTLYVLIPTLSLTGTYN